MPPNNKPVFKPSAPIDPPPAATAPAPVTAAGYDWQLMDTAPTNRPIFLTVDPAADPVGAMVQWRQTREKVQGMKGWQPKAFWAFVLTRRPIDFEPFFWREAQEFTAQ